MAKAKPFGAEDLVNLDQRGFAKILAGEQLILGDSGEITQGFDIEALEAVSSTDRKLEIVDGNFEDLSHLRIRETVFAGENHGLGCQCIFHIESGPFVGRIALQNQPEAVVSLVIAAHIFV